MSTELFDDLDDTLWRKAIGRLRRHERWVLAGKILSTVGGTVMLGIAGFINAPAADEFPWKWVLGVAGAAVIILFGGLVALAEHGGTAEIEKAHDALLTGRAALANRDDALRQLAALKEAADSFDTRRRNRLAAITIMAETVEAALIGGQDAEHAAARMLESVIHSVRNAIDYRGTDFLTVSIFRQKVEADGPRMVRMAAEWSDPAKAGSGGRSWAQGQGYTGVAWARATSMATADVIEADTAAEGIASQYPVPAADSTREKLYRSVAAIPILIGKNKEVWGVVTATCDRSGVFRRGGSPLERQAVDIIRDIARFSGLLAGLDLAANRSRPSPPDTKEVAPQSGVED